MLWPEYEVKHHLWLSKTPFLSHPSPPLFPPPPAKIPCPNPLKPIINVHVPSRSDLDAMWLFCLWKWLGSTNPVGGTSSTLGNGGSGAERTLSSCSLEGRHWFSAFRTKSGMWSSHIRPEIWIVWKSCKSAQTGSNMVPFRPHRLWTRNK